MVSSSFYIAVLVVTYVQYVSSANLLSIFTVLIDNLKNLI